MSRLRGRWLDDDHHEDDGVWGMPVPEPPPAYEPKRRGNWIDDDGEIAETADRRVKPKEPYKVPGWTGVAKGLAAFAFVVMALLGFLGNGNIARALVVAPVLAFIAYHLAQRFAATDGEPAIADILMGGLAVKFLGVLGRYWIGSQVYGRSDATEYVIWGRKIAPGLRHFHLIDIGRLRGTNFIRVVTGVIFAITPASPMVGYLVFGFMSYVGMIFFWRAFKRAMPNAPDLRYLQLLMILPSLAFWPSSIGKDAWMVMGVGIASYGVANILTNRTFLGWGTFIVGVYAVLAVRPHVGIALFAGLVIAELFRARGSQGAGRAAVSILLLFFIGSVVMSSAAAFLGIDNWSKASVNQELGDVGNRTSEGRSEFQPTPVNSPVQFPLGAFTVLFRPMPYETHSPQEFASSIENIALIVIVLISLPRLWTLLAQSRRRPYVLYCLGTITVFIIEYSSFSNFALIARQRTQITALLLAFLCLPKTAPVEVDAPRVRTGRSQHSEDL